jgi:polysaccharide pyruvyl transferase WcaK-like protein
MAGTVLFRIRPARPNIGNDAIAHASAELIRSVFGNDASIVDVPAISTNGEIGGLTARAIHDMNRAADGVIVGGGNLFENGQLAIDSDALEALRPPLLLLGISHGRIHDRDGTLIERTDALPDDTIAKLSHKATATIVRDDASAERLRALEAPRVGVGGCPTLFLAPRDDRDDDGRVLLSVRHPSRMNVPPALQWRVADDVRRLIDLLERRHPGEVRLICHDYVDVQFARGFSVPLAYFNEAGRYLDSLRRCHLSVTYRLHAFLPCVAFGTPSIHLSYDERASSATSTAGMAEWDIDLLREQDVAAAVEGRADDLGRFRELRGRALSRIADLRAATTRALESFAETVEHWKRRADAP